MYQIFFCCLVSLQGVLSYRIKLEDKKKRENFKLEASLSCAAAGSWMAAVEPDNSLENSYLVPEDHFEEGIAEWVNEDDEEHGEMSEGVDGDVDGGGFSGDPSTLSRPDFWRVSDIKFHLTADFDGKVLKGFVDLDIGKETSEDENLVRFSWVAFFIVIVTLDCCFD